MSGVITVNGILATRARVVVPWCGVWQAEVTFPEPTRLTGPVTMQIDGAPFLGVVADEQSGQFANVGRLVIVAGRGGWRRTLSASHEHNDGGLTRSRIATKTALECGETIAIDPSADAPIGVDFVRRAGPASRVLDQLFPNVPWWVEPATGITRVGAPLPLDVTSLVSVLDAHPTTQRATLVADDVRNALPGGTIVDPRFESTEPFVIRDVEIEIGDKYRIHVIGGADRRDSKLGGLFRQVVEHTQPRRAFDSTYKYRIIANNTDKRLDLQVVSRVVGLPDLRFVPVAPGLAGASSVHTLSAIVLVQFIEGDPAQPIVIGLAPAQDPGFVPTSTKIEAITKVEIPGQVPVNAATCNGRALRWGDTIMTADGPLALAPPPVPVGTMANFGTTVLP